LRHSVWRRWIEGRRGLWGRWGGIKWLCMCDCDAEEGQPSSHENPRERHPLKSRRLHCDLLRADVSAQLLWIDNTTIDTAVPAGSGRHRTSPATDRAGAAGHMHPSPFPAGGGSTAQRVRPEVAGPMAGSGGRGVHGDAATSSARQLRATCRRQYAADALNAQHIVANIH
jgi:hypothetical protein